MTDKTWLGGVADYGTNGDWSPSGVPTTGDTAIFGLNTTTTTVDVLTGVPTIYDVDAWRFTAGNYTVLIASSVSVTVQFHGAGISVIGGSEAISVGTNADVVFHNLSSAGNAVISVHDGGIITFTDHSDGGTAQLSVGSGSSVDFSSTTGPLGDHKVHVGSIEGSGGFNLGSNTLIVGGNNLPMMLVTGNISGSLGSALTKVGTGTLTLSGINTFTGAITIDGGTIDLASQGADLGGLIDFGPNGAEILRIENAALSVNDFAPAINGFGGGGNEIDLPGLPFVPGASATYNNSLQTLSVTNGLATIKLDSVSVSGSNTNFAVIPDGGGGSDIVLAIIEHRPNKIVDAKHHPPGQPSPTNRPDVIIALGANDTVKGLGGNDSLVGGARGDKLFGGPGADHFIFDTLHASPPAHPDEIMDFSHAQLDKIDLSGLLALVPGDVPLVFIGAQTFAHYFHTHPGVSGMVRYVGGEVQVTFNHHAIALEITMHNAPALHLDDFML
jgi:autotransporter-associated beta strand protein